MKENPAGGDPAAPVQSWGYMTLSAGGEGTQICVDAADCGWASDVPSPGHDSATKPFNVPLFLGWISDRFFPGSRYLTQGMSKNTGPPGAAYGVPVTIVDILSTTSL